MPTKEFRDFKEHPSEDPKRFTNLLHEACKKIITNHIKNDPNKNAEIKSTGDPDYLNSGFLEVGKISTKHIDNNQPGMVGVALYYKGPNTFPFNINKTHPQWLHFMKTGCEDLVLTEHDMEPEDEKSDPKNPDSLSIDGEVVWDEISFTDLNI